jgi:hypothetical protein
LEHGNELQDSALVSLDKQSHTNVDQVLADYFLVPEKKEQGTLTYFLPTATHQYCL